MVPNRPTRVQVQEKFKRNFQALCAKCPQLGKNHEALDDSLTSLQWLCNLNVNLNPAEQQRKSTLQPNGGLLPPFPRNLINGLDDSSSMMSSDLPGHCSSHKMEFGRKTSHCPSTKPSFAKPGRQITTGGSRALTNNGRKTSAPTLGRSNFPSMVNRSDRSYSSSAGALKTYHRIQESSSRLGRAPGKVSTPHLTFETGPIKEETVIEKVCNPYHSTSAATLPQIDSIKLKAHKNEETSSVSSSRHYSFSPREATLDLLPGQVDYKNNPYVKPAFSFTTLICMAIQNSKRHRMTFQAICKWISDNFKYYRYADVGWQDAVKLNLTQSKYFNKVHKKKDSSSKSCMWEINRSCNVKLRDVNSPVLSGTPTRNSPRLGPVPNQISPASSIALSNLQALIKLDPEESLALAGRKRKQSTPQKLVRRRSANAKKRRNNMKSPGNRNLLQEEAPELGSLKGDFNWNSIFDEFFDAPEEELSVTPTLIPSRPSTNESSVQQESSCQTSDDFTSGSLLPLDMFFLPDLPDTVVNDENSAISLSSQDNMTFPSSLPSNNIIPISTSKTAQNIESKTITLDSKLHSDENDQLDYLETYDENADFGVFDGLLQNAGQLDLTVTGTQIEPPPEWIPVCPELDAILCEKQNDILEECDSLSSGDTYDPLSFSHSGHNNPEQYLSFKKSKSREKKTRKSDQMLLRPNISSPREGSTSFLSPPHPLQPWQEVHDATETIESLLSSGFHCN